MFVLLSQEKGVGGKKRGNKCPEAAIFFSIGLMGVLQGIGIAEGFVASHEKSESVSYEDLFDFLGGSELFDHGHG